MTDDEIYLINVYLIKVFYRRIYVCLYILYLSAYVP